jgi:hypothetical protein
MGYRELAGTGRVATSLASPSHCAAREQKHERICDPFKGCEATQSNEIAHPAGGSPRGRPAELSISAPVAGRPWQAWDRSRGKASRTAQGIGSFRCLASRSPGARVRVPIASGDSYDLR